MSIRRYRNGSQQACGNARRPFRLVRRIQKTYSSAVIHYSLLPIPYLRPWRFSSEYAEDDTATVYYNYRHYEPVMGRWLGRDPIFDVEHRDGDVLCLHSFVNNSVLNDWDMLGLNPGPGGYGLRFPSPTVKPGLGGAGWAAAGLYAVEWAFHEKLKSCDSCPDGEKACLDCCDHAALTAHIALTASAVLATAKCLAYGPWGMIGCAAMVDAELHRAGDGINEDFHKCSMRCLGFGGK